MVSQIIAYGKTTSYLGGFLKGVAHSISHPWHAIQQTLGADCNSSHLWNIIYSFHMPAFMAVSDWLAFRGETALNNSDRGILKFAKGGLFNY